MTFIHSLKSTLELSRVEFSRSFPKPKKQLFSKMSRVEKLAKENDVYVKLTPSEKKGNAFVQVLRKGINHIADIPKYALTHDIGDQVYVNWEQELGSKDVPSNEFAISAAIKHFCKNV